MANTEPQLALADIQEPVLNTFWPPAPGWWLLALVVVLLLAYGFRFFWKKWQKALPLRQAKAELQLIKEPHQSAELNELLKRQEKLSQARVKFTEHAMQSLQLHSWPGNVRELANLLERMVIMYPDQVADVAELPEKYRHLDVDSYVPQYPESLQERDLLNELFQADDEDDADDSGAAFFNTDSDPQQLPEQGLDLKEYLAELEIRFISQALERHEFVVARAAEVLGLRRTTLVEKMRKYNLGKDE